MMTAATAEIPNNFSSVPDTVKQEAEQLKDQANKLFQAGKYNDACTKYSDAIKLNPFVPAYWSNRAFANLKLENYGYAIRDANEALKLDSAFIKAYYRRATANMALSKFKESLKDFRTVVKFVPNDPDAKAKLTEVEKIVRRMDFEKALAYDVDQRSVVEKLNIDDIVVDSDYDAMRWDHKAAPLSLEFVQDMISRFEAEKRIHRKYAYQIMLAAKNLFEQQPTLVDIKIPDGGKLTVCGDVHGQYYDLLNIFRTNGFPSEKHGYLFNGDFVDRGSFSVEVILTLLAFKVLYPNSFFLARGNHETISMNSVYGFEGEVKSKYTDLMFKFFTEIFNAMPLCNLIEKRVFVVHGGLFSRDDVTLDEIKKLDRFCQPPNEGLMCEMLWADPQPEPGRSPSKRGVGFQFGPDVTKTFCELNGLDMIVRSHEVKEEGYVIEHDGRCVTVFSAPNYCDQVGNKGAYINITKTDPNDQSEKPQLSYEYVKFEAVPHPTSKPMQYAGSFGRMFGI